MIQKMFNENAAKLREAARLVQEVQATLDTGARKCASCGTTHSNDVAHAAVNAMLTAVVTRLERSASWMDNGLKLNRPEDVPT